MQTKGLWKMDDVGAGFGGDMKMWRAFPQEEAD